MTDPQPGPDPTPDHTPEPTPDPNPTPDPTPDPGPGKVFSEDYVKTLRTESAGYRKRANAAESRVKELESGQSEDLSTAQNERDTLKTQNEQLRERIRRAAFIEEIGLPSARLAYASVADLALEVEYDDDDRPTNLDDVRKALKKEFPQVFGDGSADGGAGSGDVGGYEGAPGVGRLRHAHSSKQ